MPTQPPMAAALPAALPAALLQLLPGLKLGPAAQDASNRCSFDGLTMGSAQDGALEIGVRRVEATSLRFEAGAFTLEIGRIAVHQLAGRLRHDNGLPRLASLEAASAELTGVKFLGPLVFPTESPAAASAWSLAPLAAADGTIRSKIVDAHLLFDADVTVPIRQGQIDFNQATVEHVGPDSRMGVSPQGIYVDAANGRSYLYQFPSGLVPGVEYERRGALPGPWGTQRGHLRLQPFGEWLVREALGARGLGLTEQARLLLGRTALAGEVQVGDGSFSAPGLQASLTGRAEGRNAVRLHSEAVGRGVTAEMAALSVRNAELNQGAWALRCDEITARLLLRLFAGGAQLRSEFELASMNLSGLHLQPHGPG